MGKNAEREDNTQTGKIFTKDLSDKGTLSKIYKESLQKKFKNRPKTLIVKSQKKI